MGQWRNKMNGVLVKWIHGHEPTNICVIIREYLQEESKHVLTEEAVSEDNPLYLVYDFVTNEYFYALEEELHFI